MEEGFADRGASSALGDQMLLEAGSSHTDWSLFGHLLDDDEDCAADALEQLVRRYWPAIYAFVRSSGRSVDESADTTQGFICDVVLHRRLLHSADKSRGRFRTLLMRSIRNYLHEQHRHQTRRKRRPDDTMILPLNEGDIGPEPAPTDSPETAFLNQWSASLVRHVLRVVETACAKDGLNAHWTVFEQRVARPMLFGTKPIPYSRLVQQLDLESPSQAANMLITVKRRFARTLYAEVAKTVHDPAEVRAELTEILGGLEAGR